jgi:hypothetical protein
MTTNEKIARFITTLIAANPVALLGLAVAALAAGMLAGILIF